MKKIAVIIILFFATYCTTAQHIQYRDKRKPVENKGSGGQDSSQLTPVKTVAEKEPVPKDTVAKTIVNAIDTSSSGLSKGKFTMNPRLKKPYVEEQNFCDLLSDPDKAPQLPVVINNVAPEMVAMLKARYKGRLYSITGLNMIDERLKYKLKICDKDKGKFRSEYLDKDANVVNDPDLDYD